MLHLLFNLRYSASCNKNNAAIARYSVLVYVKPVEGYSEVAVA
jgi:hypothetical protein